MIRVLAVLRPAALALLFPLAVLAQPPVPTLDAPPSAPAQAAQPPTIPAPPQIAAKAWILVDAHTGRVIAEHEADTRLAPASITKMMTGYVLSREIAAGKVKWEDKAHITPNAWAQNPQFVGSSLMWVDVNSDVALKDLYYGLVISSGNDASVAIAEHLAGAEDSFAEMMNQEAARLGMSNSHFMNSHGLPDPQHYTTARDLATLSRAMINDHPLDYAVYGERYFTFNNIRQMNRNELLGEPGVDGIKTGHTADAGYCLVSSAVRDGMRLVAVVLGTQSRVARTEESRKLLGYGFRFYETRALFEPGKALQTAKVWSGASDSVELGVGRAVPVTFQRGRGGELQAEFVVDPVIEAPLAEGAKLGKVVVRLGDEVVLEEPLVAIDGVEEGNWFRVLWDSLTLFFLNLF